MKTVNLNFLIQTKNHDETIISKNLNKLFNLNQSIKTKYRVYNFV